MINKKLEKDVFMSQELSLVAALLAWNFPLVSINKLNSGKVMFVFSNTPELQKAIQAFWNNTGIITPKKYFYALREAKSRIYGE